MSRFELGHSSFYLGGLTSEAGRGTSEGGGGTSEVPLPSFLLVIYRNNFFTFSCFHTARDHSSLFFFCFISRVWVKIRQKRNQFYFVCLLYFISFSSETTVTPPILAGSSLMALISLWGSFTVKNKVCSGVPPSEESRLTL